MVQIVEFQSQGTTLRGKLYLPEKVSRPSPIVVMAHGFSATIDGMVADRYAEVFHEAGLAVLLYDHHSFGISDGKPRQEINKWIQTRGYSDAIDYVATLPAVNENRIAIWGDSLSGSEVIVAGAVNPRVRAIVAQVPACGNEPPPPDPEHTLFAAIKDVLLNRDLNEFPATRVGPMPVVSFSQSAIPSHLEPLTAFRWFIEYGGRYSTNWDNRATVVSLETSIPLHPALCAPHLAAPLMIVVARDDEMPGSCSDITRLTYGLVPDPKYLVEVDGGHFGLLYYPGDLFTQVSRGQRDFLVNHLM